MSKLRHASLFVPTPDTYAAASLRAVGESGGTRCPARALLFSAGSRLAVPPARRPLRPHRRALLAACSAALRGHDASHLCGCHAGAAPPPRHPRARPAQEAVAEDRLRTGHQGDVWSHSAHPSLCQCTLCHCALVAARATRAGGRMAARDGPTACCPHTSQPHNRNSVTWTACC